ncbi:MAG TPA: hypothetical protein VEV39_09110 [Gemmatimonadales bacterium]|nr:hypothetical protein [Gemmatimonadales bacterium]
MMADTESLRRRLAEGLRLIDPHHRLRDRPVKFRQIDARTIEIIYRDVTGIAEAEVLGIKRIIGRECFCVVEPQTAETITVRFVVPVGD